MKNKERIAILETEISRLKVANRNNTYRIEAIESHLAEQHKGANFSKLNIPESVSDAPDYTHLLPDGYEFCSEADAEKWVKVEYEAGWPLGIVIDITDKVKMDAIMHNHIKPSYRPIRPIQYKVTTHEIVTAVPDPYMPDWSQAPEGVVAHAFDESKVGIWYIVSPEDYEFVKLHKPSPFTLPADLDWKQSLRVKPSK
jgi:hypothetical protein